MKRDVAKIEKEENAMIGSKIQSSRKELKLTQQELASKVGVTASAIGQYEIGQSKPKYDTLLKIASALDVPAEWLLFGTKESEIDDHSELKGKPYVLKNKQNLLQKKGSLYKGLYRRERDLRTRESEEHRQLVEQLLEQNKILVETLNQLVGKSSASNHAFDLMAA